MVDIEPQKCSECRGTGKILLLTSARTCDKCQGSGRLCGFGAEPTYSAVIFSVDDRQFLEGLEMMRAQIFKAFGIPADLLRQIQHHVP